MNARSVSTTRGVPLERIRNIGIAAHIDAGKTTLTERILYHAGAIHRMGEVHDGTATTDFNPLEQQKGITIFAAAVPCDWTPLDESAAGVAKLHAGERLHYNIVDTPGHVDFTAEVERSLRVLDGAIAVFSGVDGVQPQSETVWRQAERYHVPRIAFINKMDRAGANFNRVVEELRIKLGANAWPVLLPLGAEDRLAGQIDVINGLALHFDTGRPGVYSVETIPLEMQSIAAAAREDLARQLAELDDEVAGYWLDGRKVPSPTLKQAIRRTTIAGQFVPVVGGSAYRHCGVQPLLDAVADYMPSPLDRPAITAHRDGEETLFLRPDDGSPATALAFKVVHDPQSGRMVFLRVYTGVLKKGDVMINPRTQRRERLGRILRIFASEQEELGTAYAGDIIAVTGICEFTTGDTVCSTDRICWLEPPVFPQPVVSMALEPAASADRNRLAAALVRLADEDPTFRNYTHPETGQTIISGMGELHLDIIRQRLSTEYGIEANAGAPEIAYRETVSGSGGADYLLKKQNGGVGMYARVILTVRREAKGSGNSIENRVTGGGIPSQFINAVEKGIQEALNEGVHGYPVVDVHVSITDGAAHIKDSTEHAFRLAASAATKRALLSAGPVLLEPVVRVELDTPAEHQGPLIGDLTRRRARITGVDAASNGTQVHAEAPLGQLWGYAGAIRSLSKGRANYTMTPIGFEPAPDDIVAELLNGRTDA